MFENVPNLFGEITLINGNAIYVDRDDFGYFFSQMNEYPEKFIELQDTEGKIFAVNKDHVVSMIQVKDVLRPVKKR